MDTIIDIPIIHNNLSDSPYSTTNRELFSFKNLDGQIQNLVSEVINGNQTCYLVSGYRGAGKTSFVHKVEEEIVSQIEKKRKINNIVSYEDRFKKNPAGQETIEPYGFDILFVHVNFSKFSKKEYIIRHLLRGIYSSFSHDYSNVDFKNEKSEKAEKLKDLFNRLTELNQRTFLDIKTQFELKSEQKLQYEVNVSMNKVVNNMLVALTPLIVPFINYFKLLDKFILISDFAKDIASLVAIVASVVWAALKAIEIKRSSSKSINNSIDTKMEEIYDEEIADYKLNNILTEMKKLGFKVVFVLDELDKVNANDINNLINEMKPFMLSGLADYIIVAGQELAYRFSRSINLDDEVLGSLFSKSFHVPLMDTRDVIEIAREKLIIDYTNLSIEKKEKLNYFVNHLIFVSKRVPRAFFSKFRQKIEWNDESAYLRFRSSNLKYINHSKALDIIENINRKSIQPNDIDEMIKDLLLSKLFILANKLLEKGEINEIEVTNWIKNLKTN